MRKPGALSKYNLNATRSKIVPEKGPRLSQRVPKRHNVQLTFTDMKPLKFV